MINKNKKQFIALSITSVLLLGVVFVAANNGVSNLTRTAEGLAQPYTFSFSNSKNKLDSSESNVVVSTLKGNNIVFNYENLSDFEDGWMSFNQNGSFYNPKLNVLNENKISGLKSLKVKYEGNGQLFVSYGWLQNEEYEFQNQLLENNTFYLFDSSYPTYFKIFNHNNSTINVTNIDLIYSCEAGERSTSPYSINVDEGNGNTYVVNTNEDGDYSLPIPIKSGFVFSKWIDSNENDFDSSGTIYSNESISAVWEADSTDTYKQLYDKAYAGVEEIKITGNIELTGTIYIRGNVRIYADSNCTLTRSDSNTKRLFNVSSGSLTFGKDGHNGVITIDGNKDNSASAQGGACIYSSGASKTVNLYKNIVIQNSKVDGNNGGAVYVDGGTLNINGAKFYNNTTTAGAGVKGGAIYAKTSGTVVNINETNPGDVVFVGNTAAYGGGAIYAATGVSLTINGGTFTDNIVTGDSDGKSYGGALYLASGATISGASFSGSSSTTKGGAVYCSANGDVDITNSLLENNTSNEGGALMLNGSNKCTIEDSTLQNNNSSTTGGAISCGSSVELTINGTTFDNNTCTTTGAALYSTSNDNIEIVSSVFVGNESTSSGGAIYSDEGTASLSISGSSSFVENISHGQGGAVYIVETDFVSIQGTSVNNILFSGNTANESGKNGGALYLYKSSNIHIEYAKFEDNQATNAGVAYVHTSTANFNNCTFGTSEHGNKASNNGGVFLMAANSHVILENCSATDNYGNRGGFACFSGAGDMTIKNLVASNNKAKKADNGHFILSRAAATVYTDSSQISYNGGTVADLTTVIFAESGTSGTMTISDIPEE